MKESTDQHVGIYSNALLALSDDPKFGPYHADTLRCLQIVLDSLDAPKAGEKVKKDSSLLYKTKMNEGLCYK